MWCRVYRGNSINRSVNEASIRSESLRVVLYDHVQLVTEGGLRASVRVGHLAEIALVESHKLLIERRGKSLVGDVQPSIYTFVSLLNGSHGHGKLRTIQTVMTAKPRFKDVMAGVADNSGSMGYGQVRERESSKPVDLVCIRVAKAHTGVSRCLSPEGPITITADDRQAKKGQKAYKNVRNS